MKIILAKRKTIPYSKKKELKEAGFIVIEVEDANDVQVLSEFENPKHNLLLPSALEGLNMGDVSSVRKFVSSLTNRMLEAEKKSLKP